MKTLLKFKAKLRLLLLKHILSNFLVIKTKNFIFEKKGSDYGGWFVPINIIDEDWICYCAGVGEDASFDLALIEDFGCQVFAFDPTPRAKKYVEEINNLNFHFFDYGVWSKSEELRFYEPRNSEHVSHSIVNLQNTSNFFLAHCKSVPQLAHELNHAKVNLLKLDIEGAEFEVLNSIIDNNFDLDVLCVEFDQPASLISIVLMIKKLNNFGMSLIKIDDWNFTFIKKKLV